MIDFEQLVARQRDYFLTQATKPREFRMEQLKKLMNWINTNEQAILDALESDLGKSAYEAYLTEVAMVKQELKDAMHNLKKWMKPRRARTAIGQLPGTCRMYSEPYGVTLIMSPWNYPFQLTVAPLIGAISAGNCAVVKPSAYSAATSALIKKMIDELYAPEYIAAVEGGRKENAALLEQHFDFIFFTGSPTVGRLVMEKASVHLTPVSLELGGKSPVIVDETADIALTAKRLAWGKCVNAGASKLDSWHFPSELGSKSLYGVSMGWSNPKKFIPYLAELYKEGKLPYDKIITKFPFSEINEVAKASAAGEIIKGVIIMDK